MNIQSLIHFPLLKKLPTALQQITSLDVDSEFTNISSDKTINICIDELYNINENPPKIPKNDFLDTLNIATEEPFSKFINHITNK